MANHVVSIISGTYNRISSLAEMVKSVRHSVGIGIPYEIILVDGGSTDGTIAWAKTQTDIKLIEQSELLGAVKAFNAGAEAADGLYVILANDDIIFIDESIRISIAYMQDHPTCGVGCFYQDRDGLEWHVSQMPAVKDKKQIAVYYGQVCIVPKWLGSNVGWWGNYLHTYAGDNELSCNVLEMGYTIDPIDGASIHDGKVNDGLREINSKLNPDGTHPDSIAWRNKWMHKNKTFGAIIPSGPKVSNPIQIKLRMTFAPIYEPYFRELQFNTRHGMRDALSKRFLVDEIDYIAEPMKLLDASKAWNPDVILTQFHGIEPYNAAMVRQLKADNPGAILINWNGDYFPEQFFNTAYMEMMRLYDHCGFVTTTNKDRYYADKLKWFYWQIGYEASTSRPDVNTPNHDVVFLANYHRADPVREKVGRLLNKLSSTMNVGIYGNWPQPIRTRGFNLYDFEAGRQIYMKCKIAISDWRQGANAWVSNRFFEAMANGAFVLQQRVPELDELNGCINGVHYVSWTDIDNLEEHIHYWLNNDVLRNKIAKQGQAWATANCSFDKRVEELCGILGI